MRSVGIVLKREHPGAHAAFEHVAKACPPARFITVEGADAPLPPKIERVSVDEFENESELVVVLGGDGTL
ncbi:MAG: hypothetical protein AAF658_20060, partial [Myxococcota bacterium]